MYCEYCKKPLSLRRGNKPHINICHPVKIHLFCSRYCKNQWCYAVQKNKINIPNNSKKSEQEIGAKLMFDLNTLYDIRKALNKSELRNRFISIINKSEYQDLNLLKNIMENKEYKEIFNSVEVL